MIRIRHLSLLALAVLWCVGAVAQDDDFNPTNPSDPGVPPQKLVLVVSPEGAGSVSGGGKYQPEKSVWLNAWANDSWTFVSWTDESGAVVSTERSFSHTKLGRKETLTANFEFAPGSPADPAPGAQLVYHWLTVAAQDGGTVSGGGRYKAGTKVWLNATCSKGFVFTGWVNEEGEVVSDKLNFSYTTNAFPETLTATYDFTPDSPDDPAEPWVRRHVTAVTDEGGTVGGSTLDYPGTSVRLWASANSGYKFLGWYIGGELYTSLREFDYTIEKADVVFEARFDFNPDDPDDPRMPEDKRYAIYLMSPITHAGRSVECPVWITNLSPLRDMHFNLTFPDGFTPDIDNIAAGAAVAGYSISATPVADANAYTITLVGGTVKPGSKELFRIPVDVPLKAIVGDNYQVKINQVSVTQEDNTTCTASTRNGQIYVFKLGDSNGDGEVNILDHINLVGFLTTGTADDSFVEEVSDVNNDGVVDDNDAKALLEVIANE